MRIAIVTDWFANKMGYAENLLPKALAKLGPEVHVVSSDLQPAFPNFKEAYEPFLGPRIQPTGIRQIDGYTLHRLPSGRQNHGVEIRGLTDKLHDLRPDVVQVFTIPSWSTYQASWACLRMGCKLFLEEHIHRSVFVYRKTWLNALKLRAYRTMVGMTLNVQAVKCYPIAPDVMEICQELGVSAGKCQVVSLGVDTDLFSPPERESAAQARRQLREQLGIGDTQVLCIYTGRFSPDKNPLCLAKAIDLLQGQGEPFHGLFVGSGSPAEIQAIRACRGCGVHPFVEFPFLPGFYQAADIGVWPKQESTSQLDAMACGLPLVLSDQIQVIERIQGNGYLYRQDDPQDLAAQLLKLRDPLQRRVLGRTGAQKVQAQFSWDRIARLRLTDYEKALADGRPTKESQ
jgi:glycosyltransferase involved in cell wall biosynthesis